MSERRLRSHLTSGHAWAWRIFNGQGPWRVVVDTYGIPADPPDSTRQRWAEVPLPEGFRLTWAKDAAITAEVDERNLRKHCKRGNCWAWRILNGHGPWRVVLNTHNDPADPPRAEELPL